MKFLRDEAMQGAGVVLAILVMLLQFPEHLTWLLPLSIFFFALLFAGHKFSSDNKSINNTNWNTAWNSSINFTKNWLTPLLTILIILTSLFFTIYGILTKTNSKAIEKIEFPVTIDTDFINLHTIVSDDILRTALFKAQVRIMFFNFDGELYSQIRLDNPDVEFNNSGVDLLNNILEPNGEFQSTLGYGQDNSQYFRPFDLKEQQTLFIKFPDGGIIRIYIENLPQIPLFLNDEVYLRLIVSYISRASQRFDGLTTP